MYQIKPSILPEKIGHRTEKSAVLKREPSNAAVKNSS